MREIKFRGQRVDTKEWVYGSLVQPRYIVETITYISSMQFVANTPTKSIEGVIHEIIPETLGQFTGLLDKNGKEIYDGDWFILKDTVCKYLVEWHDTGFSGRQYSKLRGVFGANSSWVGLLGYCKDYIEIIGTIHDSEESI